MGNMRIDEWDFSGGNSYRRPVFADDGKVFLGSIWLELISKHWEFSFSMGLNDGILKAAWQNQSFSSFEKAREAMDDYLLRLAKLMAFA